MASTNGSPTPKYYADLATPALASSSPKLRQRMIQVEVAEPVAPRGPIWTYPGMGSSEDVTVPDDELQAIRESLAQPKHQLSQWPSTAICGNDILSSVLYSSGLVAVKAGKLMPIPLILVSIVLYFFRFIYEEVVTAIPLNGGSYNVLLNTTSKRFAAFGAALGIISYLATGVVSGTSAINYLKTQIDMSVVPWTIGLLFAFAVLNLIGISESAVVATGIFFFHVLTLSVLSVVCLVYTIQHPSIFSDNMHTSLPEVDFAGRTIDSNVFAAIFFGFGAALLGITGFESSAQFVEQQQPGVFRKTLRNMWAFVTLFNTVLSFMALGVLPLSEIITKKDTVLAEMGRVAGGRWLELWVVIDAAIVLSGAVLTSYVGITGLVRRLAFDRVLPAFLMKQNKWRGTNHNIILSYFVLASSLVLLLNADTSILSGVYSYAFLGLMALFAFGCMVLKAKRSEIPRDVFAPWWTCIMGFLLVFVGILAILLGDPKILMYFAIYLIVVGFVMAVMMARVEILRVALVVMKRFFPSRSTSESADSTADGASSSPLPLTAGLTYHRTGARGGRTITKAIMNIKVAPIIYFCKHADMTIINKAILYVRKNELTHNLRIVHVFDDELNVDDGGESGGRASVHAAALLEFQNIVALFDTIYPKLKIDFISVKGAFEPAVVQWISKSMDVPINMMFIAQPGDKAVHQVATLGVRVITG
uniref:Amino acid permease/ SLC12A domain-containing protein n=1 Tax=Globisporangium ultimum (strain ATCC 200006 / CBS 805.95 / DAOM BR144) TaxID=431595 RepID=K3XAH6_GLOUD